MESISVKEPLISLQINDEQAKLPVYRQLSFWKTKHPYCIKARPHTLRFQISRYFFSRSLPWAMASLPVDSMPYQPR